MLGYKMKASKRIKRAGLSIKICSISGLILLVVFSSYAYLSCLDSISEINNQYKETAISLIKAVNASIGTSVDLEDAEHIQKSFDQLKQLDSRILKVSLYVKQGDGKVIRTASSAHDETGKIADSFDAEPIKTGKIIWEESYPQKAGESEEPEGANAESETDEVASSASQENLEVEESKEGIEAEEAEGESGEESEEEGKFSSGHIVEVLAPITVDGKRQASLGVYMDLEPKDLAVINYINRAVIYAVMALILVTLLLYYTIRKELFEPLHYLSQGVREVAVGNLDRKIDLDRNDELGELAREFDSMTEALLQREEENKELMRTLKDKWIEAEEKSHIDYLTGLENHRSFQNQFTSAISLASRNNSELSIIFCDLDNFKSFNDINGHQYGDKALSEVAEIIGNSIRAYDVAARYGGEEFALILPQAGIEEAAIIAERIRKNVEDHLFSTMYGLGYLTISIGISSYPNNVGNKESVIAAADTAMYVSKRSGKNKVSIFSESEHDLRQISLKRDIG
jgi:diguanylate cyclase (GGDEF)-like protein